MTVKKPPVRRRTAGPPVNVDTEQVTVKNEGASPPPDTLREDIAALKQAMQDVQGHQRQRIAADVIGAKLPAQMTQFQAIVSIIGGLVALAIVGFGALSNYGGTRVQDAALLTRVLALEGFRTEATMLPSRVQSVENTLATSVRLREQQSQAAIDRLHALELADQSYMERLATLAQTLATISARIEDILRRQEGLERRLDRSGYLPPAHRGDGEAPAVLRRLLLHAGT